MLNYSVWTLKYIIGKERWCSFSIRKKEIDYFLQIEGFNGNGSKFDRTEETNTDEITKCSIEVLIAPSVFYFLLNADRNV